MPGAYLFANLVSSTAAIAPSTEDEAYPVGNLYDKQAAKVFRRESKTGLPILINLLAAMTADSIAIVNHNFTNAAAITLKAGAGNPPTTVAAILSYREHDLWKAFASTSARYWLLTVTDTNALPFQIGQLVLGERIGLPRARRIGEGYRPSVKRHTISGETYAGVLWNYHVHQRKQFNPSFRVADETEEALFRDLDAFVYGNLRPFLYIPDVSGSDCHCVRKEMDYEPSEYAERTAGPGKVHNYVMNLVEESRGLDIRE